MAFWAGAVFAAISGLVLAVLVLISALERKK